ncbi:MAG: T9SS type A sorting domain-containing protein [Candidatus Eisenbacteria bacterium]|nr:T9SS type A sorting domain-containing protein [Candidatus Eisenbacteria bacterium]
MKRLWLLLALTAGVAHADTIPPTVTVLSPNGSESYAGTSVHAITWIATDNVDVTSVDIYYRDAESAPWQQIARNLLNSGSWNWPVHLTPTTAARVRVVAKDIEANAGEDQSDALFTITRPAIGIAPTTLRDFHQPGTQPFGAGTFQDRTLCGICHGGYNQAVEPDFNFQGSMMAQAARDPLFFACLTVAEQDAPGSGDLCLRCHTPGGWMSGRSNPTNGTALSGIDRDGVGCDPCHRAVDPIYEAGVSPIEDAAILAALPIEDRPTEFGSGMYVADHQSRRRGPFTVSAPHPALVSPFHRESDLCGTCHDVSNPVFTRTGDRDYVAGAFDAKAVVFDSETQFPLERTYSEWKNSTFNTPSGVYAPEFAGNKPGGYVSTCQDCHMKDVVGKGCNGGPTRNDLPLHDLTGGNYWMPNIIAQIAPGEVDPVPLAAGAERAVGMLRKSALVDVVTEAAGDSFRAVVTVTNRTGHKLPSGYPEGRRMWLGVVARDALGTVVYQSGRYEITSGELIHDDDIVVYEAKLGVSPALAGALGVGSGASFHFALNDTIVKDNRIPPLGFTNAAYATFGGHPVDPDQPGARYADGQNWDVATYPLPPSARKVVATLYYQTTSKEYIEFLRDTNVTDTRGQTMYDLWVANNKAAPVTMTADSLTFTPADVSTAGTSAELILSIAPNPTLGHVTLQMALPRPAKVSIEVIDLTGRRVYSQGLGLRSAGPMEFEWNGLDDSGHDVPSGIYFARVRAGSAEITRRVVRL